MANQIVSSKVSVPILLASALAVGGCGDGKQKQKADPAPPVDYAEVEFDDAMTVEESDGLTLTALESCQINSSGLLDMRFSRGAGTPALRVQIKDFSADKSKYTCRQASDNTERNSVGLSKFNGCAVDVWTNAPEGNGTLNKYTMYREDPAMFDFVYGGNCTITTTYDEPEIRGKITCRDMIQVEREGLARVPIDPSDTISIVSPTKFFCDIVGP